MIEIIHFLPALDKSGVSNMIRSFYDKMDKEEIRFHFVHTGQYEDFHADLIKNGSKIYYLNPLSKSGLRKYINEIILILSYFNNDSIVHIHTNYLSGIVAYAAKKANFKIRFIHIRGILCGNKVKYLLFILRKLIISYGTTFLAVSKKSGEFYYKNNVDFTVINNGVDLDVYKRKTYIELEDVGLDYLDNKPKILLQVARLAGEKNHFFSLEILKKLIEQDDRYYLVLAGDGELSNLIKKRAKELAVLDNVIFLGVRDDISNLMNIALCTLLPSFSEGLPNVVIQSQAVGTPCICSNYVTSEVDMKLDLVSFISLDDISPWVEKIINLNNSTEIKSNSILEKIRLNGFDLNDSANVLYEMYCSMVKSNV